MCIRDSYTTYGYGCDYYYSQGYCSKVRIPLNDASPTTPLVDVWRSPPPCAVNGCSPATGDSARGAWAVGPTGRVSTYGAQHYGDLSNTSLNKPIVGMSPTADSLGYWLVASDGGIFSFGDARFYGSTGAIKLNKPIVGMSVTPTGKGYWLVASDGGIFSFGDARFYGSTGNLQLISPIAGMMPSDNGYFMVATDGGVFAFGDARFGGSLGGQALEAPIIAILPTLDRTYILASRSGQTFACGQSGPGCYPTP